jgi:hypothetical protein
MGSLLCIGSPASRQSDSVKVSGQIDRSSGKNTDAGQT